MIIVVVVVVVVVVARLVCGMNSWRLPQRTMLRVFQVKNNNRIVSVGDYAVSVQPNH